MASSPWRKCPLLADERRLSAAERRAVVERSGVAEVPQGFGATPNCGEYGDERGDRRDAALEPARRPDARQVPHDEAEIEATSMNQEPLQNVRMAAQMRTPHATRVIEVGERSFDRCLLYTSPSPRDA